MNDEDENEFEGDEGDQNYDYYNGDNKRMVNEKNEKKTEMKGNEKDVMKETMFALFGRRLQTTSLCGTS